MPGKSVSHLFRLFKYAISMSMVAMVVKLTININCTCYPLFKIHFCEPCCAYAFGAFILLLCFWCYALRVGVLIRVFSLQILPILSPVHVKVTQSSPERVYEGQSCNASSKWYLEWIMVRPLH